MRLPLSSERLLHIALRNGTLDPGTHQLRDYSSYLALASAHSYWGTYREYDVASLLIRQATQAARNLGQKRNRFPSLRALGDLYELPLLASAEAMNDYGSRQALASIILTLRLRSSVRGVSVNGTLGLLR